MLFEVAPTMMQSQVLSNI